MGLLVIHSELFPLAEGPVNSPSTWHGARGDARSGTGQVETPVTAPPERWLWPPSGMTAVVLRAAQDVDAEDRQHDL